MSAPYDRPRPGWAQAVPDPEAVAEPQDADLEDTGANVVEPELVDADVVDADLLGDEPAVDLAGAGTPAQAGPDDDDARPGPVPGADALADACRERDEYLDALRRVQADFENYRKRVQRQQDDLVSRAAEQVVIGLLPSLDAFDLAESHLVGDEQASPAGLRQAAALLRDTLAKEGLEQVAAAGDPFDPTAHDAVDHVEAEPGDPTGPVVDAVLRPGYRWKGRVVRPAMVKVRG